MYLFFIFEVPISGQLLQGEELLQATLISSSISQYTKLLGLEVPSRKNVKGLLVEKVKQSWLSWSII